MTTLSAPRNEFALYSEWTVNKEWLMEFCMPWIHHSQDGSSPGNKDPIRATVGGTRQEQQHGILIYTHKHASYFCMKCLYIYFWNIYEDLFKKKDGTNHPSSTSVNVLLWGSHLHLSFLISCSWSSSSCCCSGRSCCSNTRLSNTYTYSLSDTHKFLAIPFFLRIQIFQLSTSEYRMSYRQIFLYWTESL